MAAPQASAADIAWFNTYLAGGQQNPALIPAWMDVHNDAFQPGWRRSAHTSYTTYDDAPLPSVVHISLDGKAFYTDNGVHLSSWIERGAIITG